MGKQAKLKELRRIAATLPRLMTYHRQGESLTGAELLEQGITKTDNGDSIPDSKSEFHHVKSVEVPVNHSRNLKRAYQKFGEAGIRDYIAAVQKGHQLQTQQSVGFQVEKEEGR